MMKVPNLQRLVNVGIPVFIILIFNSILYNSCTEDENPEDITEIPPVASFTVNPSAGNTLTIFVFDASASDDNDPSSLKFRWDWDNDNVFDTPYSNDPQATHKYDEEGNYAITLEVKDAEGLTDTDTKQVTVSNTGNLPPDIPSDPSPLNDATGISITSDLSWTCSDPNGDPLTYDIYIGTNENPPLAVIDHDASSWSPGAAWEPNVKYYWRIVATDDKGESTNGPIWKFTTEEGTPFNCGDNFLDTRDGNVYGTFLFNDKCWMTKNLNYGTRINGSQSQTNNDIPEKYCYDDDEANCNTYGALYQWAELMQYTVTSGAQGLCPAGWHPATLEDWKALEIHLGMNPDQANAPSGWQGTDQGKQLKENIFQALLGGYRSTNGGFVGNGSTTTFWTSTESNEFNAWTRTLDSGHDEILHGFKSKEFGYPVRCVKN